MWAPWRGPGQRAKNKLWPFQFALWHVECLFLFYSSIFNSNKWHTVDKKKRKGKSARFFKVHLTVCSFPFYWLSSRFVFIKWACQCVSKLVLHRVTRLFCFFRRAILCEYTMVEPWFMLGTHIIVKGDRVCGSKSTFFFSLVIHEFFLTCYVTMLIHFEWRVSKKERLSIDIWGKNVKNEFRSSNKYIGYPIKLIRTELN